MHCATHSGAESMPIHKRGAGEAFSRTTQPLPTCLHAANATTSSPLLCLPPAQLASIPAVQHAHTRKHAPKRRTLAPGIPRGSPSSPSTALRAQHSGGLARLPKAHARAVCRAGSWEASRLTWKLLQIVLDGLKGCGLVADDVQRVVRRCELPFNS